MTLPGLYCFIIYTRSSKKQKIKVSVASCNTKMELNEKNRTMTLKALSIKVETGGKKKKPPFVFPKKNFYSTVLSNYRQIAKLQHSVYLDLKFPS